MCTQVSQRQKTIPKTKKSASSSARPHGTERLYLYIKRWREGRSQSCARSLARRRGSWAGLTPRVQLRRMSSSRSCLRCASVRSRSWHLASQPQCTHMRRSAGACGVSGSWKPGQPLHCGQTPRGGSEGGSEGGLGDRREIGRRSEADREEIDETASHLRAEAARHAFVVGVRSARLECRGERLAKHAVGFGELACE